MHKGLGRRHAPDDRDKRFALQVPQSSRSYRYWYQGGVWLDQGATSQCVAYAFSHWLEDGPVTQPDLVADKDFALAIYGDAQRVDEWPGENYDGTSVRAGAKVLQGMGLISTYRWAWNLDTALNTLLEQGPLVVGTNWYSDMFSVDEDRMVTPGGGIAGGHAYVINGINLVGGFVRLKNSWGRDWGYNGHARMTLETFERLLHEDGECCLASELVQVA